MASRIRKGIPAVCVKVSRDCRFGPGTPRYALGRRRTARRLRVGRSMCLGPHVSLPVVKTSLFPLLSPAEDTGFLPCAWSLNKLTRRGLNCLQRGKFPVTDNSDYRNLWIFSFPTRANFTHRVGRVRFAIGLGILLDTRRRLPYRVTQSRKLNRSACNQSPATGVRIVRPVRCEC